MHELNPLVNGKAENSINRGLRFLCLKQKANGSWDNHPGITALAASAFLRSPVGYASDEWNALVDKALDYIYDLAKPDGGIYSNDSPSLNTAVSIIALCLSKKSKFNICIKKAQQFLIQLHCDESTGYSKEDNLYGGFQYGGDRTPDMDNLDYALQALKSSGLSEEDKIWENAVYFIQRCQNRSKSNDQAWSVNDGGFVYYPGYSMAGGTRSYGSMTSAGISSFFNANVKKEDPRVADAFRWIREHYSLDENPNVGQKGLFHYYYTLARALSSYGEPLIKDLYGTEHNWKEELVNKLSDLQQMNGHWVNECQEWWEGNKVLMTSYAVITLSYLY